MDDQDARVFDDLQTAVTLASTSILRFSPIVQASTGANSGIERGCQKEADAGCEHS